MADFRFSVTQRNELYSTAVRLGLDPAGFQWLEEENDWNHTTHRIVHTATGAFFRMLPSQIGSENAHFTFDYWPRTVEVQWARAKDSDGILDRVKVWLGAVQRESVATDLWKVAQEERAWIGATDAEFKANDVPPVLSSVSV